MKKILVTGGSGFIGSHLIYSLRKRGHYVEPSIFRMEDEFKMKAQISSTKWDVIIHLAGMSSVEDCNNDKYKAYNVNTVQTYSLAKMLSKYCPSSLFIFASTSHVYGASNLKLNEESTIDPLNVYGDSKLKAEFLLRDIDNLNVLIMLN